MSEQPENNRYRAVAMIPTEIFVDAADLEDAASIMDWLFQQYPTIDYPVSSETESIMVAAPRVISVEAADKIENTEDYK